MTAALQRAARREGLGAGRRVSLLPTHQGGPARPAPPRPAPGRLPARRLVARRRRVVAPRLAGPQRQPRAGPGHAAGRHRRHRRRGVEDPEPGRRGSSGGPSRSGCPRARSGGCCRLGSGTRTVQPRSRGSSTGRTGGMGGHAIDAFASAGTVEEQRWRRRRSYRIPALRRALRPLRGVRDPGSFSSAGRRARLTT
jgi:hypothetical protein